MACSPIHKPTPVRKVESVLSGHLSKQVYHRNVEVDQVSYDAQRGVLSTSVVPPQLDEAGLTKPVRSEVLTAFVAQSSFLTPLIPFRFVPTK